VSETTEKTMPANCEGDCQTHTGDVLRVRVTAASHDYGVFRYCATARREDERRGLNVRVVEEGDE
jgi:hypothetical protein